MYTRKLAMNGMLAALCAALGYVALDFGSMKITFESLPVLMGALLFGPADGALIGGLGTLLYQLVRYGVSATTLLWILPYVVCGLLAGWLSRRSGFALSGWRLTAAAVLCQLVITALNTLALCVDGMVFDYFTPEFILVPLLPRLVLAAAEGAAFAAVLPALLRAARRALGQREAGGEAL